MSALPREQSMIEEYRIVKLEADVAHLLSDMGEVKQDVRDLQVCVGEFRTEFHSYRTEAAKDFGAFREGVAKEFGSFRTEVATRFGAVDAQVESLKTSLERYARLVVVWTLGGVATIIGIFGTLGHALKWF
jgi:hypothetical protein